MYIGVMHSMSTFIYFSTLLPVFMTMHIFFVNFLLPYIFFHMVAIFKAIVSMSFKVLWYFFFSRIDDGNVFKSQTSLCIYFVNFNIHNFFTVIFFIWQLFQYAIQDLLFFFFQGQSMVTFFKAKQSLNISIFGSDRRSVMFCSK